MKQDVIDRVIRRVAETAGIDPSQVGAGSTFEELGLDSLSAVSLVGELEEEFGVDLPNDEVLRARTVGDALASLDRALAAGQSS